jgi:hypothetical protein
MEHAGMLAGLVDLGGRFRARPAARFITLAIVIAGTAWIARGYRKALLPDRADEAAAVPAELPRGRDAQP